MPQKPLELTVQEAMNDISRHSIASLAGFVSVHSSVFRNVPLMSTLVNLQNEPGQVIAGKFGAVLIHVPLQDERKVGCLKALLLDGQLRVQKTIGENFVCYSLKGDVVNPFNKGWFGLGLQTYHYSYSVKVGIVAATMPAYSTA